MNADDLWKSLHDHFRGDDDGTLPDLVISPLASQELCDIYRWVRASSEMYDEPTLWDNSLERDVPIAEVVDPASAVLDGSVETFRHGVVDFVVAEVDLPPLTITVQKNQIEIDYRMGRDWGPSQVEALFNMLVQIQKFAPSARIAHFHEGLDSPTEVFARIWDEYRREHL